jgi:hypothetical protein
MQNDKASKENPYVCKQILDMMGEPSGFYACKAINIRDDKYRVNIYVREDIPELTVDKTYISNSYTCQLDKDKVTILDYSKKKKKMIVS